MQGDIQLKTLYYMEFKTCLHSIDLQKQDTDA